MTEVDQAHLLGHLPPHVRTELLRRVSVITRYIADKSRTNAEAGAAELGLSIVHFKKLVHVWELHGRADRLPGADWPKTKGTATTDDQLAILREASDAAAGSTVEAVVRKATELAISRGIRMPSRGTMRDRVIELRQRGAPESAFGHGSHLVVVHAALNIPIHATGVIMPVNTPAVTMPVAAMAVHPATRQVLGISLSVTGLNAGSTAMALRDALDRLPVSAIADSQKGPIRMAVDTLHGEGWSSLKDALVRGGGEIVGEVRPMPRRDLATVYLGRKVGGIEVRPRHATRPVAERHPYVETGQTPLTIDEALDFATKRMVPTVQPAARGPAIDRLRNEIESWLGSNG